MPNTISAKGQMFLFLKSLSRTVHHYQEQQKLEEGEDNEAIENEKINEASIVSLTVWRKSLIFNCSGFTVVGPNGNLAYRVDNYSRCPYDTILMDGFGNPIFTIRRPKKLKLMDYCWLVYEGEVGNHRQQKPVLCVRKNMMMSMVQARPCVLAYVYRGTSDCRKRRRYAVEGSYAHRSCKILDESRRVVGEIRKKAGTARGASFGIDVFELVVKQGLDTDFGMAIVLMLDQMFSSSYFRFSKL